MNKLVVALMSAALVAAGGCGKSKDDDAKGGATCAEAASNYVAMEIASGIPTPLAGMNPTPAQVTALTALIQGHCETGKAGSVEDKPWTGGTRSCIAKAKPRGKSGGDPAGDCFKKMGRAVGLHVEGIVIIFMEAEKAKAAAVPPPPPPPTEPPPSAGSADPAAGSATTPP